MAVWKLKLLILTQTKMTKTEQTINLTESLKKLTDIVQWFESDKDIDIEEGLLKVKEGADLIKACKTRLAKIENEFLEIQKEVNGESPQ